MSKFKNLATANAHINSLTKQLDNQIELVKSLEEDIERRDERIKSLSDDVYSVYSKYDSALEQVNEITKESHKIISDLASSFKVLTDKIK